VHVDETDHVKVTLGATRHKSRLHFILRQKIYCKSQNHERLDGDWREYYTSMLFIGKNEAPLFKRRHLIFFPTCAACIGIYLDASG